MKKSNLLFLLPALALGLASCNDDAVNLEELAESAIAQVSVAYNSWASTGLTTSQTLIGATTVYDDSDNAYTFNFTYSLSAPEEYTSTVSISDADDSGNYTLNVLYGDSNDIYTIAISAYYEETLYATGSFNCKILAVVGTKIADIYNLSSGSVTTYGYYLGAYDYGGSGANRYRYFGDGDSAIICYYGSSETNDYSGIEVGDLCMIVATVSPYSGLWELTSPTVTKVSASEVPETLLPATPTTLVINADNHPTWTTDADSAKYYQSRVVQLEEGEITSISGSVGASITIVVDVAGTSYTIYEHPTYCGELYDTFTPARSDDGEAEMLRVGDIISLEGWGSAYSNPQIIGAKLTSVEFGDGEEVKPTEISIHDLYESGDTTTTYIVSGYVTGTYQTNSSGTYIAVFIQDGDYGLLVYSYTASVFNEIASVGDAIQVTGSITVYSGLVEFAPSNTVKLDDTSSLSTPNVRTLTSFSDLTIYDTAAQVTGSGTLTSASGNYAYVELEGGDSVTFYLYSNTMGEEAVNAWLALEEGTSLTFYGWIGNYKSSVTLDDLRNDGLTGAQVVIGSFVVNS